MTALFMTLQRCAVSHLKPINAVREDGSVLLTATAGESSHEHVLVLGSVGQPLPDHYTDEHLKTDLDAARKFAASMAASKQRKLALPKEHLTPTKALAHEARIDFVRQAVAIRVPAHGTQGKYAKRL